MIRVAPEMSEFYLNADRTILCRDIKEILQYIFDKPNTYKELYELIQFDDTLSVPMRRDILGRMSNKYIDDTSLINLIYEATYIAVTRQYTKDDNGYIAMAYSNPLQPLNDVLFANSEYIAPCRHFCGRDKELDELHSLVQDNSTVIITGIAGIGKSELVRAYAKEHQKEYRYFGYYFYGGSLKDIISNVIRNPVTAESDFNTRYQYNL
ncbi:MAG: ATP-binding protein, partial [Ruminococcus sp.]|nr:ATP-binding protein [Ruminococcus sp.]